MKLTGISILIGAHRTIPKGLVRGLVDLNMSEQVETIQITGLLRSARILRRVQEIWVDFLSHQWKNISKR